MGEIPQIQGDYRLLFERLCHEFADPLLVAFRQARTGELARDLTIVDSNPAVERLFEYTSPEVIGRTLYDWAEMTFPSVAAFADRVALFEKAWDTGTTSQLNEERQTKSGRIVFVQTQVLIVRQESTEAIVLRYRDLTQRWKLEQSVRAADGLYALSDLARALYEEVRQGADLPRIRQLSQGLAFFLNPVSGNRELHELNEEVRLLLEIMGGRLEAKGIQVERYLDPEGPLVNTDRGGLVHALINLLRNAEDALEGRPNGRISVRTQSTRSEALILVEDNGPGVPLPVSGRIFEPFFTTRAGRAGVGLAVAYEIVKGYGGDLRLDSSVTSGARFIIELPVMQRLSEKRTVEKAKKRVLVVEDEDNLVRLLTRFLTRKGYEVASTANGAECLRKIVEDPPDILLLDVILPGKDGLEILTEVKTKNPQLPVVMVSGVESGEVIQRALRMGASAYVTKPFDLETVVEVLEQGLRK